MTSARFALIAGILSVVGTVTVSAQEVPPTPPEATVPPRAPNEKFIPADQLEAVFNRDGRGVLMKRAEFQALLEKARANAAKSKYPVPVVIEKASLRVTPGEQLAGVRMELKVTQFEDGWQVLRIPVANLLVEKAEVNGKSAIMTWEQNGESALLLAHEKAETFTVVLELSSPIGILGSDRTAAFQLPQIPATELTVNCPAGRHLMVNDLKLERPAAEDAAADYVIPAGAAPDIRLRWVVQRRETEAQTLVFVSTDAQLRVQKEAIRWESNSRISVFGGTINQVVAQVPARMEITSIESAGLESWTLDDDPQQAGQTRVTMTWRQPFTNDRLVHIRAVTVATGQTSHDIPTLKFNDVTSHSGRLVVTHEEGLRLAAKTGGGIRSVSASEAGVSTEAAVFDFWQQQFELSVSARPRDRELFAESLGVLQIDDTAVTFTASLTIETLNAPLFELPVTLPADWQLSSVSAAEQQVTWNVGSDAAHVVIKPEAAVPAGGMLSLTLQFQRAIADPDTEQKLSLPVVLAEGVTVVGGTYTIRGSDDLVITPLTLTGLTAIGGSAGEQVFQNPGTSIGGELSIVRRPARLASRSVLRTWADVRHQSLDAEIIVDVLSGTIRTLTVRVSESLGPDVRFYVQSVGAVPGLTPTRPITSVSIVEQTAGTPQNGLRPFVLKLDHRFAGSLSLRATTELDRAAEAPISAPVAEVADAVRQHGVLVFEASPDQQLMVGGQVKDIPGLFVADAGLVDPPDAETGRRIALTYRFVQPGYTFQVTDARFGTIAVPSAICEELQNICTLNQSGTVQRWCQARFRTSGVQTLRFRLPGKDPFLWSTVLNDEPVEVRREGDDYLVALPTGSEDQQQTLTVLFEAANDRTSAFGKTSQSPVQFLIDAGADSTASIDVLKQTWQVHYPPSTMLIESEGPFRAVDGFDQPGWLMSLWKLETPTGAKIRSLLISMSIFAAALFVITLAVIRKRWFALGGLAVVSCLALILIPSLVKQTRNSGSDSAQMLPSPDYLADDVQYLPPSTAAPMAAAEFDYAVPNAFAADLPAPAGAMGGRGGFGGGGGGMGGGGMGAPGAPAALPGQPADMLQQLNSAVAGMVPGSGAPEPAAPPAPQAVPQSEPQAAAVAPILRKGVARLSVNVNLEIPNDYLKRQFVSVADSVHRSAILDLRVQDREQISIVRLIAAVLSIFVIWRQRKRSILWQLAIVLVLLLCSAGLIPLLSNKWQSILDGVAFGALAAAAMMALMAICTCLKSLPAAIVRIFSQKTPITTGLMMLVSVLSLNGEQTQAQDQDTVAQPDIVVPYSPEEPALRADKVFIRHDDFLKIFQQANPDALPKNTANPLGSSVVAAYYRTTDLKQVDGTKHAMSFEGRYVVWSDSDQPVAVNLPIGSVAIRSVQVDGNEGSLTPLQIGESTADLPDFAGQQVQVGRTVGNNIARAANNNPAYSVQIQGRGLHVVDIKFDISATIEGALGRADFPFRSVAAGTLEWTLPADDLDAKVNGRTNIYHRDGRKVIVPIAQLSTVRLQWLPKMQKVAGDVVFHSVTASALSVQDSGLQLRTSVGLTVRQGEVNELEVTIPEGYSIQSVTGEDVAGWTAQSTDATRSLKLQFRRAVNDGTKITMQLFAASPSAETLASLSVPISIVRGSSRDTGTVVLRTGPQFQTRADALSGVSQMNPGEAPNPDGEEMPGRPMMAWRYTRHPASVLVKVSPTADELITQSMHAVRLEEQRQLWSSRLTLQIKGSPRSRLDLVVPKTWLALDVSATALKDWYFVESDDPAATTRTLSIQLTDARSGSIQIALQGQMNRDADRTVLTLAPPQLAGASQSRAEMSVWLDAASESVGVGEGSDWVLKPVPTIDPSFREISLVSPSLAFASNAKQPGSIIVKLREAISTLIAESVTVSNVTETSLEITLALKWQIARAAANQFAVELPAPLAALMTFDVPGQRKLVREDAGNGKTRVIFHLQTPVTEQYFVLGNANLPLPSDRVLKADVPTMVIPGGAPSTLSGQSHFWVLVNQSGGLLQPTAEQPADRVSVEQISTKIPPQLLQQAVLISRLKPDTSSWNLVYPERQQVAPAIVTLATHVTVLSDDGSWRSLHQLQVTNESRQFLPVVLPKDARLMYCLVQGRPTRVVVRGTGEDQRYLIPIPQSGALASGFDVSFALAGRFADSVEAVRTKWASERLSIPVPTFPEFREDPEFGISISRNRWSIYVPESWHASEVRDPALTNVIKARNEEIEDAAVLSEIERSLSLLSVGGNAAGAQGQFGQQKLVQQLDDQMSRLLSLTCNDATVSQQRDEVWRKLEVLRAENGTQPSNAAQAGGDMGMQQFGNGFLYEQDLGSNRIQNDNNLSFFSFNSRMYKSGYGKRSGDTSGAVESEKSFRFQVQIPDVTEEALDAKKELSDRSEAGEKSDNAPAFGSRQRTFPGANKASEAPKPAGGEDAIAGKRSQLMQRRSKSIAPEEKAMEQAPADPFAQAPAPQQMATTQAGGQSPAFSVDPTTAAVAPPATPSGLLSLQFDIPQEGYRLDFLRVGGNPNLSLDVRSADAVNRGTGLVWTAVCLIGALALLFAARAGSLLVFLKRLAIVLIAAGLSLAVLTSGSTARAGLTACVVSALILAVVVIIQARKRTLSAAT
ncbi:MAG: hypothetical protein U0996_17495 [Planctomycetaceae bacterium]